ncbi:MAG: hypothetical protein CFH05_00507 [Alphaproteobacteria bacterium MarineAlpha3_Bin4]|nr:MAG: hypothetical protein CFH05_00507 [Alphaproteobacteria bacterium MarineAlpha3_Bin4]
MSGRGEKNLLPLIRHLSACTTPLLARLPVTPNQITSVSMLVGLAAAWYLYQEGYGNGVAAAALFVVRYVLDNCDGEIARLKGLSSSFGMHYDTFVDWVVHSAFFAALGIGYGRVAGNEVWMWMGWAAAVGGTINYLLVLAFDCLDRTRDEPAAKFDTEEVSRPATPTQWAIFVFRELMRADFCFLVLLLALADGLWLLLPAGAVGAQVYWIMLCVKRTRRYNV